MAVLALSFRHNFRSSLIAHHLLNRYIGASYGCIAKKYWTIAKAPPSLTGISRQKRSLEVLMSRIRIILPTATIERTKLYLMRGAAVLLCVLIFPLAAHASPFDSGISSIQTLFTGTIAKA